MVLCTACLGGMITRLYTADLEARCKTPLLYIGKNVEHTILASITGASAMRTLF